MRFLVDNQLPAALSRWLNQAGVECEHVLDIDLAQAPDREVWQYAAQRGMVIISKDEDFLHHASQPSAAVQFVWIRLGNCRNKDLIAAIGLVWPQVITCLEAGDRIVEVR